MSVKMNIQGGGAIGGRPGAGADGAGPRRSQAVWRPLRRLLGYMRRSGPLIALTLLVAVAGTVMQVLTPKLLGGATTVIFEGVAARTGVDLGALAGVLAVVGALYLGVFLASFLQERLMTVVSLKTTETLRNAVMAKLNRVPVSFFDAHPTGDLMSVAVNDIDNIAQNLQQSLTMLITSVILVAGTLAIMLTISPALTLLACVILPASTLIAKLLTPLTAKNNKRYFAGMGALSGSIEESYQNFTVVKSFGGEQRALDEFRAANTQMREAGWRAKFFGQSMMHLMMLVQNLIYVLIAALGGMRVVADGMAIGDMQAFLQYSQQFSSPVAKLSGVWGGLLSAIASAERVFALLDAEEMGDAMQDEAPAARAGEGKIVFDDVRFGYGDTPLMAGFHLEVAQGQTVAIVGHTGAGKTTLVNLLERFYEIQGGGIRLDGVDIRSADRAALRRRMGMVLQDSWLFSGSVLENIRFGCGGATDEQLRAAARAAYADEFICSLPDGYDTLLDEDAGNLSQGQRQLLTIARAFLSDPEILILDEATSNVDSRTEMIVQKAMRRLMDGRTCFVIVHRLSTIRDADRIVVMERGDIVETGTHAELLGRDGVYADIYQSQFRHPAA